MNQNIRAYLPAMEWTYERIRKYLQTGDIVLFNGAGFISDAIGFLTGSQMSHVGMVVRTSYEVQILHAGWTKAVHGVQLTPFGEYVRRYRGEVFVRFLNCKRDRAWFDTLHGFIAEHRGTSYEKGIGGFLELLGAKLRINRTNEHNLFCSELVAGIFKRWEYLPANIPSNNYQPKDFEQDNKIDVQLRAASVILEQDIWLSPLQKIVK